MEDVGGILAKLGLDTSDFTNDLERAKAALKLMDAEIARLKANVKSGAIGLDEYAEKVAAVNRSASTITGAMGNMAGATRNVGRAALEASRAFEDMFYGINGVINNIPSIVQSFGGSAGLTAAISVGSVVAYQLGSRVLPMLADSLGLTSKQVDPLKTAFAELGEKIKTLEDKKIKLAVDRVELAAAQADLDRLVKGAEAFNEARSLKSKAERESESAVKEVLGEAKGDPAMDLRESIAKELESKDTGLKALRDKIKGVDDFLAFTKTDAYVPNENSTAEIEAAQRERQRLAVEAQGRVDNIRRIGEKPEDFGLAQSKAGNLLEPAKPGEDVAAHQAELADALKDAGREDVAAKIRDKSPAAMKAAEQFWKEMGEEIEAAGKAEEEADKEAEKLTTRRAKSLGKGMDARMAAGETIGADEVRDRLQETTRDPVSDQEVNATLAKIQEEFRKRVEGVADQHGISEDDARDEILADEQAKRIRAMEAAQRGEDHLSPFQLDAKRKREEADKLAEDQKVRRMPENQRARYLEGRRKQEAEDAQAAAFDAEQRAATFDPTAALPGRADMAGMPGAPALSGRPAGGGEVNPRTFEEMLVELRKISGNTDDMDDGGLR